MSENHFSKWHIISYGVLLMMNAMAYIVLSNILIGHSGENSTLAQATGKDLKGKTSIAICITAIIVSFYCSWVGFCSYWVVAIIWFIPNPRIENRIKPRS